MKIFDGYLTHVIISEDFYTFLACWPQLQRKETLMKLRTLLTACLVMLVALPAMAQVPRTVIAELGSATW